MLLNPFPFKTNFEPVWVPSGILYFSFVPSTNGISISVPKVAPVNVIGISHNTWSAFLVYILCFFTWTFIYKSPFGPPLLPGSPSPLSTTVWPSSIPSGIFTFILADSLTVPFPLQSWHGSFIIFPSPPQFEQTFWVDICPNGVVTTCFIFPVPLHTWQVIGFVPGFAPVPWQCSHFLFLFMLIVFSTPLYDSSKVISRFSFKSAPFLGPFLFLVPPPKAAEKISPKLPNPKSSNPENPPKPSKPDPYE